MKLKVLIGTAYYKNEDLTKNWIKNIQEQELRIGDLEIDLKIMIVNGGSEKVEAPSIYRVDLPENISFSGNFNYVLKEFLEHSYDYVIIMNNDSYFNDTKGLVNLVVANAILTKQNKYGIVSPTPNTTQNYAHLKLVSTPEYSEYVMFPAICWCMNKETVKKVGLLDEQFKVGCYEDDDYCKRLNSVGGKIYEFKLVGINHIGSQTMQLFNYQKAMNENAERFKKKWMKK